MVNLRADRTICEKESGYGKIDTARRNRMADHGRLPFNVCVRALRAGRNRDVPRKEQCLQLFVSWQHVLVGWRRPPGRGRRRGVFPACWRQHLLARQHQRRELRHRVRGGLELGDAVLQQQQPDRRRAARVLDLRRARLQRLVPYVAPGRDPPPGDGVAHAGHPALRGDGARAVRRARRRHEGRDLEPVRTGHGEVQRRRRRTRAGAHVRRPAGHPLRQRQADAAQPGRHRRHGGRGGDHREGGHAFRRAGVFHDDDHGRQGDRMARSRKRLHQGHPLRRRVSRCLAEPHPDSRADLRGRLARHGQAGGRLRPVRPYEPLGLHDVRRFRAAVRQGIKRMARQHGGRFCRVCGQRPLCAGGVHQRQLQPAVHAWKGHGPGRLQHQPDLFVGIWRTAEENRDAQREEHERQRLPRAGHAQRGGAEAPRRVDGRGDDGQHIRRAARRRVWKNGIRVLGRRGDRRIDLLQGVVDGNRAADGDRVSQETLAARGRAGRQHRGRADLDQQCDDRRAGGRVCRRAPLREPPQRDAREGGRRHASRRRRHGRHPGRGGGGRQSGILEAA